jgi:hypothetical protein
MIDARAGNRSLVYGNLALAWIALRPWFADAQLRRLVRLAARG